MTPADADSTRTPVRRALVSVYDKTGLEDLAVALHETGVALVQAGAGVARFGVLRRAPQTGNSRKFSEVHRRLRSRARARNYRPLPIPARGALLTPK